MGDNVHNSTMTDSDADLSNDSEASYIEEDVPRSKYEILDYFEDGGDSDNNESHIANHRHMGDSVHNSTTMGPDAEPDDSDHDISGRDDSGGDSGIKMDLGDSRTNDQKEKIEADKQILPQELIILKEDIKECIEKNKTIYHEISKKTKLHKLRQT